MSHRPVRRQLLIGALSTVALIAAASLTRPVFLGRTAPMRGMLASNEDTTLVHARAPWLRLPEDLALASPKFIEDREAFVLDLIRTGKVDRERAWKIADVAVREAYKRRVPPALVLGVMLTENDELKSTAKSKVGALGLMQVHPRPWRQLTQSFGGNLRTDSTNLKTGIYILGHVAAQAGVVSDDREASWRSALLRYNGCVRGTNTPDCRGYPDVVRRNVLRFARFTCHRLDFTACVSLPLWMAKGTAASEANTGN